MPNFDFDVAILGGGMGGYPAAIRASQLGLKVALVEADICDEGAIDAVTGTKR